MLNKLSFRNARRSVKDYLVYIITMTIISSLMFAFNGLLFSSSVRELLNEVTSIAVFIGLATFFVVIIVIWLTKYIINFMLEKRSKEFGTYLLIGMDKKQVSRMFKREHLLLGTFTFLLGLIPGYLLHLALITIFFTVFDSQYQFVVDINIYTYLLTLAVYFFAYFLALLRINRKFKKMEIRELLYLENNNEVSTKRKSLFLISLAYLFFFHLIVYTGHANVQLIWPLLAGLFASIYGLFIGLSGYLTSYIQKKGKAITHEANIFIFRQLASKIKTMRFTMGSLTILFAVTILSWMFVLLFSSYQKEVFDGNLMDIDVFYLKDHVATDFSQQLGTIEKYGEIEESYTYHVYDNDKQTKLNEHLYETVKGAYDSEGRSAYFDYDTYMLLSDYNHLRAMAGFEAVSLEDGEYLIQGKEKLVNTLTAYGSDNDLSINSERLTCRQVITDPFSQSGMNGADYILVVPNSYASSLTPYYSILAANVASDSMYEIEQALEKDSGYLEDGDIEDKLLAIKYGTSSEQLITFSTPILVRESLVTELDSVTASASFTLGYVGIVFLVVAMSILAVQQLSDASKYKYRYQILKNLGMNRRERNKVIVKQLAIYYLCPVVIATLVSAFTGVFASDSFAYYTGLSMSGVYYYLIALVLFLAIFFIYFLVTYISFVRAVEK
ncbi:ABC transporter permease [Enterococcus sp. BWR-S5]|uniref:ABC transporter permease n=1 Tax=Enterococcus sp. BWR-S5 TaxID=2787714 RepID=UPI001924939A|nr:ABC transporter permease [Enterococcus sp. BWR-S5]MBL1225024.1 ABC transporter permease [Enterococcus sp. BWR-S5]